jgi:hypothetical protein
MCFWSTVRNFTKARLSARLMELTRYINTRLAFFQKIRFNAMALAMLSGSALIRIPRVSEGFTISNSRLYFFANDVDFGKGFSIIVATYKFFILRFGAFRGFSKTKIDKS